MLKFNLLTIFPNIFDSYFNESIIKRAMQKKKIKINVHNIRDYAKDKYRVDDRPYGGGPGMVLKIEPIFETLKHIVGKKELAARFDKNIKSNQQQKTRVILTDPDGNLFSERDAQRLSKYKNIVIISGHYEGIDARVGKLVDERISVGNYIITGGELATMVMVDAITRLIPGVLGNPQSLADLKHYQIGRGQKPYFDYPHYTRPEVFSPDGKLQWKVPKVLLSGDHKNIKKWREKYV